jgi:hypothetical protein
MYVRYLTYTVLFLLSFEQTGQNYRDAAGNIPPTTVAGLLPCLISLASRMNDVRNEDGASDSDLLTALWPV